MSLRDIGYLCCWCYLYLPIAVVTFFVNRNDSLVLHHTYCDYVEVSLDDNGGEIRFHLCYMHYLDAAKVALCSCKDSIP